MSRLNPTSPRPSPPAPGAPKTDAVDVLLVEDNPGDVRLTKEAFKEGNVPCNLRVAEDGVEALAMLRGEGKHSGARRPDLILLDLKLPKKDGHEVLAEIKGDSGLRSIPVVVLTSSSDERDIRRAYELQANCYITKPIDPGGLARVVKSVEQFWLLTVRLPSGD